MAALVVAVLLAVLGPQLASDGDGTTGTGAPEVTRVTGEAAEVLETIPVKGRAPTTGYDRVARFGEAWTDVDANGCDTRNDILLRDLDEVRVDDRCRVLSGVLHSPYSGKDVAFRRGVDTSAEVQIDHVVALQNAWVTGAQQLDDDTRTLLANDPLNLIAADGASNQQKSASDAASWLPADRGFRCAYVARQIGVKAAHGLWVTPAEGEAMRRVLSACPGQTIPDAEVAARLTAAG
ncbi:HNH endonuclease family protein [Mycetocola reblochoni]|uniref:HNH endonuclease n=2 Tax=Mycetocola reblochoni TaxID=331618 RepID=A0A3L6ZSM3_9MICO|nr:HNH endonuclease family protein [Mycetocola reblochoni]RLP70930.1 HNH endonuclease [Mycetocola reblochoni]SJN24435.1 putative secreted protein [Mycetocola reblochoni REB411]